MRRRLGLGVLSLVCLVLVGEVALRLYGFGRSIQYRPHARLGWEMVPGQEAFNVRGRVRVRVNSLGFRGPELASTPPPHTLRILYLGDGTVIGNQTPEEQIFPFRVQQDLQRHWPQLHVESILGAASGYQLEQELELLLEKGLGLQPDLVVLGFGWNDWASSTMRGPGMGPLAFGELEGRAGWYQRLALWDFRVRLARLWDRRKHSSELALLPEAANDERAWTHVQTTLDSITTTARHAGAEVALLVLPARLVEHAPEEYVRRERQLREWAAGRGVVYACPQWRGDSPAITPSWYLDALHLSSEGHRVVAEAAAPLVRSALGPQLDSLRASGEVP